MNKKTDGTTDTKLDTKNKCVVCHKYGLEKTGKDEVHCTQCESTYSIKLLGKLKKV